MWLCVKIKKMKIKKIKSASNAYKYPLLIKRILADSLKYEPTHEIFYRDIFKMNYYELNDRVRQMANVLQKLKINGGQTIGFMDYDSHRFLEGFFAIPMTGNVLHTINWRLSEEQILYTINHAADSLLIVHEDFLPLLNRIWNKITTVKKIIICSDTEGVSETNVGEVSNLSDVKTDAKNAQNTEGGAVYNFNKKIIGEYEDLLKQGSKDYYFPDFDEDAVATTFYTTGTTGNPKGVYFTHRQLVLHTLVNAAMYGGALDKCFANFNSSAVFLGLTPFFHVHGWGFPYYATMIGAKQVYAGRFSIETFADLFQKHKPTLTTGVPSILQMFLSSPLTADFDFSKMKMLIGGSALNRTLAKQALERGIDILSGYGMSEAAPMICAAYLNAADAKIMSLDEQINYRAIAGLPAFMVDMKIIDENGQDLPQNGENMGEIVIRAPWLTQGYYNEPEKSEELWKNGWLYTGDVATIDAHKYVRIGDRIKDVIKTGGEWISSIELENIIAQHPAVSEVAVVGLPDEKWGERPHAIIVLKKDAPLSAEEIKHFFQPFIESKQITKWSLPDKIVFIDVLPKTSVGKVDKKYIRQILTK
jgi:fatty-acyl-CoA synthase